MEKTEGAGVEPTGSGYGSYRGYQGYCDRWGGRSRATKGLLAVKQLGDGARA